MGLRKLAKVRPSAVVRYWYVARGSGGLLLRLRCLLYTPNIYSAGLHYHGNPALYILGVYNSRVYGGTIAQKSLGFGAPPKEVKSLSTVGWFRGGLAPASARASRAKSRAPLHRRAQ
jgi:hypothetical protein